MPIKKISLLTHAEYKNALPAEKEYSLTEAGGLSLVVRPDGNKRWLYRYRVHGKADKVWLGYFDAITVAGARKARDAAQELVQAGKNPRLERQLEKVATASDAANTFEAVAREWHQKQLPRYTSTSHPARVIGSLERDVFPTIGQLPVKDIEAGHVLAVIRAIEARGVGETAARILQRIGAVMRYAMHTRRAAHDPTYKLSETLTHVKVANRPAMPRSELPEYFRRLAAEPLFPITKLALELLAYTFVRPGELRGAVWSEFDIPAKEWRIPAERMKMRAPHVVYLSRQSLAVLAQLQPLTGPDGFVFPVQASSNKPMSENAMGYALNRMGYKGIHCPHGFRSLASTVLNEEGFNADVIERQLAHAEKNKIRAAYHRAQYLPERATLLQWWADFLDSKRPNANVIPMKPKAA